MGTEFTLGRELAFGRCTDHCYCIEGVVVANLNPRRTKPHMECCKCGDLRLAPWHPDRPAVGSPA